MFYGQVLSPFLPEYFKILRIYSPYYQYLLCADDSASDIHCLSSIRLILPVLAPCYVLSFTFILAVIGIWTLPRSAPGYHLRVLNYRPPPINDEETYLTRRQRATLSQLRSGYCKLLNSYKKRLKQTDSSSCPDCGMDPQDVPHLFNCTVHPTALTPENFLDRPVKYIRELSFPYPENLE